MILICKPIDADLPIRSDTKLKKHEPQTKNEKMDSVF